MKKSFLEYLEVERGLSENTTAAYRRDLAKLEVFARDSGKKLEGLRLVKYLSQKEKIPLS